MSIHVTGNYRYFVDVCIRGCWACGVMYCSIRNMRVFGVAAGRGAFGELVDCL
jgi:hypothetical protein